MLEEQLTFGLVALAGAGFTVFMAITIPAVLIIGFVGCFNRDWKDRR